MRRLRKKAFQQLIALIGKTSAPELAKAKQTLAERERRLQAELVETELAEAVKACPHCGHTHLLRAGSKGGRPRRRCKQCKRSFNAFTGKSLARLHHPERFWANAACMVQWLSIRDTASRLRLSASTVFRWRHCFLKLIEQIQPEQLSGVVEVDETFFLESFKGSRHLPPGRKAKKRGTPAQKRGLSKEQVPVLVARGRDSKATMSHMLTSRKSDDIAEVLLPKLAKDALVMADSAAPYIVMGRTKKVEVRTVPPDPKRKTKGSTHINNVNSYHGRLKSWMKRFRGVATKYLHHYLGWHRWLDAFNHAMKSLKREQRLIPAKRFLMTAAGL